MRFRAIDVWPFGLGQSDKYSFIIWVIYVVLWLMDSEVVPTMSFVYELVHMMKENLIRQGAGDWIFKIIKYHWEKTLRHPLHVVGT